MATASSGEMYGPSYNSRETVQINGRGILFSAFNDKTK
jgi:hypothetical protein